MVNASRRGRGQPAVSEPAPTTIFPGGPLPVPPGEFVDYFTLTHGWKAVDSS